MRRLLLVAALSLVAACGPTGVQPKPGTYNGSFDISASAGNPWPTPYGPYTLSPPPASGRLTMTFVVSSDGKRLTRLAYWSFPECKGEGSPVERDATNVPVDSSGAFSYADAYNTLQGTLTAAGSASGTLKGPENDGPCDETSGSWSAYLAP